MLFVYQVYQKKQRKSKNMQAKKTYEKSGKKQATGRGKNYLTKSGKVFRLVSIIAEKIERPLSVTK